jgi:hypothetical protein
LFFNSCSYSFDVLFKGQGGGMGGPFGGMGGPMEFGKNKSKFQETPETGISFDDVAVSAEDLSLHTAHVSAPMVLRHPEESQLCSICIWSRLCT